MNVPTISDVLGYDDAELGDFLGHADAIKNFRAELTQLNSLEGKAKAEAERMWNERITPSISPDSLRWMKEDAIRAGRKPKDILASTEVEDLG